MNIRSVVPTTSYLLLCRLFPPHWKSHWNKIICLHLVTAAHGQELRDKRSCVSREGVGEGGCWERNDTRETHRCSLDTLMSLKATAIFSVVRFSSLAFNLHSYLSRPVLHASFVSRLPQLLLCALTGNNCFCPQSHLDALVMKCDSWVRAEKELIVLTRCARCRVKNNRLFRIWRAPPL